MVNINLEEPDFEILLSSTLYLLSRNPDQMPSALSKRIYEHFVMLLSCPEIHDYPLLQKHCTNLMNKWKKETNCQCHHCQPAFPSSTTLQ